MIRGTDLEVLIWEGPVLRIDRVDPGPVPSDIIPALAHEILHDPMKRRALVPDRQAVPSEFARTELAEVLGRARDDIRKELELDPPNRRLADGEVHEDHRPGSRGGHHLAAPLCPSRRRRRRHARRCGKGRRLLGKGDGRHWDRREGVHDGRGRGREGGRGRNFDVCVLGRL